MSRQLIAKDFPYCPEKDERIGNFTRKDEVPIHRNNYREFRDGLGNEVWYSDGAGDSRVIVRVTDSSYGDLWSKATKCLSGLLALHDEKFMEDPYAEYSCAHIRISPEGEFPRSIEIHVRMGNRATIAYELMAALSGVPILKAAAPFVSCGDFVRCDHGEDVRYVISDKKIELGFSSDKDISAVVVRMSTYNESEDLMIFERVMTEVIRSWVTYLVGAEYTESFLCETNRYPYKWKCSPFSLNQQMVDVDVQHGSFRAYSLTVPYYVHPYPFGRIAYAQEVMGRLTEVFASSRKRRATELFEE